MNGRDILLDVTLCFRSMGRSPDGILRAERNFALAALDIAEAKVAFCRYDRRTGQFYEVRRQDLAFIATYDRRTARLRPRGRPRWICAAVEFLNSSDGRRYHLLRWDIRRFLPLRVLSRRLDRARIGPNTVYTLAGLGFDTHDPNAILALKRSTGASIFVLCFDIVPIVRPEYYQSPAVHDRFKRFFEATLRFADRIGVISEATRRDVAEFARTAGIPLPPTSLVLLGTEIGEPPPSERPDTLPDLRPGGYVLCVGNINVRKNHDLLYRLWARLVDTRPGWLPRLVLVGQVGWKVDDLIERIRTDARTCDTIMMLNDVDDRGLAWLYANCLFTLYPSLYEGWGLPVSESLGHGKYCITSSTSSMPEAAAGLAATLDPLQLDVWEAAVVELLDDPRKLEHLHRRIGAEFRPLTWRSSAQCFFRQVMMTGPGHERTDRP